MYPKKGKLHPRLFTEVLEAIASLKESKGSTKKNIVEQVEVILSKRIKRLRHDATQIQKALKHGISTGLIKHKNGKYILGLDQKDYGVFRKLQKLSSRGDLLRKVRGTRGRKKRGGKKRRNRRRSRRRSDVSGESEEDDDEDYDDDENDDDDASRSSQSMMSPGTSASPEDRGRRGRRRRSRKGRRRSKRRGKRQSSDGVIDIHRESHKHEVSPKSSDEAFVKSQKDFDLLRKEEEKPPSVKIFEINEEPRDDESKCENPGCLCNSTKGHQ